MVSALLTPGYRSTPPAASNTPPSHPVRPSPFWLGGASPAGAVWLNNNTANQRLVIPSRPSLAQDTFQRTAAVASPLPAVSSPAAITLTPDDEALLKQTQQQLGPQQYSRLQAEAYKEKGNEYFLLNHYELAASEYLKALYADPSYTDAYYNLGRIYALQRNVPGAIEAYRRLIMIDPSDHETRVLLANSYSANGQYQDSLGQFQAVLQSQPAYDPARRGMAYLQNQLQGLRQPQGAQQAFNQQAQQTLHAAKTLIKDYYQQQGRRDSIQLVEAMVYQFAPTQLRNSGDNMAEFDFQYPPRGLIRLKPELAYAGPPVVGAYLVHELTHALDGDAISSIMEEQDAYRDQTRFWIAYRGDTKDPNLDMAANLMQTSVDQLDQEVRRSYGDDHLLPEKSPGHGLPRNADALLDYNRAKLDKLKSYEMQRIKLLMAG